MFATPTSSMASPRGFLTRRFGRSKRHSLSLALQGGGAHGAFTWGVLDRLLEDPRLEFDGLSGASAGALNAVVMASGLAAGGAEEARGALERFWRAVADAALFNPLRPNLMHQLIESMHPGWSPPQITFDLLSRVLSPYQFNPLDINPLRAIVEEHVDFERLKSASAPRLFIAATDIGAGQARIFQNSELSLEAIVASACLPFLHQAVVVDGASYWDGGYTSNPPVLPLVEHCAATDIVLVRINRPDADQTPVQSPDIFKRLNRIVFNSSLESELKALDLARQMADEGFALGGAMRKKMRRLKLHQIDASESLRALGRSNSLNPDWTILCQLRDDGRKEASDWLESAQ